MTVISLSRAVRPVMLVALLSVATTAQAAAKPAKPASTAPTCPAGDICMTVIVDNQNAGVPATGNTLYLTLVGADGPTTLVKPDGSTFSLNQSVPFSDLVPTGGSTAQFTLQTVQENPFSAGRLYFSETDLAGNQPAPNASFRYDYVEFSLVDNATVNADVSGIDQVGIPSMLELQDANGKTLDNAGTKKPAVRKMGCWNDIYNAISTAASALSNPAWDASSVSVTVAGTDSKLRLAGPTAMPSGLAGYPSMQNYILGMNGQTVTISGYFAGNTKLNIPSTYYQYSGTFDSAGNLALSGTLTSDKAGGTTSNPNYPDPQTIYLPGQGFYDTLANTSWYQPQGSVNAYGTGFGVYAQNGPYQLGGTQPTAGTNGSWDYTQGQGTFFLSIGNDVYGWIYGDLVASMADGFLGPLGYDTSKWNTNTDGSGTPYAKPQKAFAALYTSTTLPQYAAWDLWQQAVSSTSDSYGVSLGDRFNFQGAKSSSPDMSTDKTTGIIKVTLLPNDGCKTGAPK